MWRQNIAGHCQQTFENKKFVDNSQQLKQTFLPIIWIFNEGEGDGIKSRLPFKIFSTLKIFLHKICQLIVILLFQCSKMHHIDGCLWLVKWHTYILWKNWLIITYCAFVDWPSHLLWFMSCECVFCKHLLTKIFYLGLYDSKALTK